MLRQHWKLINHIERLGDNLVIIASFYFTYYFRNTILDEERRIFSTLPKAMTDLGPLSDYFIILFLGVVFFNAVLSVLGAYRSMRFMSFTQLCRIFIFSSLIVFLCQGAFLYLLKLDLSRSFVAIYCLFCGLVLIVERAISLQLLRYFRLRGKNFRNVIIVGTGTLARKIYQEIVHRPELGIRVKGFVNIAKEKEAEEVAEVNGDVISLADSDTEVIVLPARVIAEYSTYERALKKYAIDEVLFTDLVGCFEQVKTLAEIAVEEGVQVSLAADLFSLEIHKSDISYFGNIPLIHYEPSPAGAVSLLVKRLFDIAVSSGALIVLSPLMLATAVAIRLDSEGPIFFRQRRVGLNGRIFTLLKFRSMVDKAHRMLKDLQEHNEMSGPAFKMTNDPRITSLGRFIRKYSIDELPQLFNVLRGDMSIVGPRPPLPSEVSQYQRKQRRRLSMRPGITCTWQVSGRNKIVNFEEWAKMDLEYIDSWNLFIDIKLLLKTIPAVIFARGAK
ncbi:MAG: sugar transferase [Deltaproteobacteria bacterium]|nr:sugar transferase [Deltaproteobacteria bacterium]